MKLVTFTHRRSAKSARRVGILGGTGVVEVGQPRAGNPDVEPMVELIDDFDDLRAQLADLSVTGQSVPLDQVHLLSPIQRLGKIVCCIGNYWEHAIFRLSAVRPGELVSLTADLEES